MENKSLYKYGVTGGIILFLVGCLFEGEVVDLKTIAHLQIIEKQENCNNKILTIKGLIFASSLGIDKIQVKKIRNELNVLVYVKVAGSKRSGNLDYQLSIPDDIMMITFGKKRDAIWSRKEGIAVPP